MKVNEKRKLNRLKISGEVLILIEGSPIVTKGELVDISVEGVRIKIPLSPNVKILNEGSQIQVVIKLEVPIKTKAEIKWLKEKDRKSLELGALFTNMPMREQEALKSILSKILVKRHPGLSQLKP